MSLFTSNRERRLWLWTLIVVAVIYSTLGVARTLAWALRDQGLLTPLFLLGALLIGATVVTQALKVRPGGAEIAAILGIAAAYLLVFVRMALVTERSHLIEYGIVAVFIYEALLERARPVGQPSNGTRQGRPVPVPALLAILMTALIGALDEAIQLFLPSRVFDPIDILFNFLGGMMSVGASVALAWARRMGLSRSTAARRCS